MSNWRQYWPKEDPEYDTNKSRAENYQYLRSLFERDSTEDKCIDNSQAKYARQVLYNRECKGAHIKINYTESVKDLIESGVVKFPINDFEVVFVEWETGYLTETDPIYKLNKALIDWDGDEHKEELKKQGKNGFSLYHTVYCEFGSNHKYENFPEETLESLSVQNPSEQVAATYGGNQFIAPNSTRPVVQNPSQIQETPMVHYTDIEPTIDWANNRKLTELENQMAMNVERNRLARAQSHRAQFNMLPQAQGQRFTNPDELISHYIQQEGLVNIGDGMYINPRDIAPPVFEDDSYLVYDSYRPEEIQSTQQYNYYESAYEGQFIGVD